MSKLVRHDKKGPLGLVVNPPVFWSSIFILVLSVALTLIFRKGAQETFSQMQAFMAAKIGWLFILSVNVFLLFCLVLAFSGFGKIRVGGKEARPEFSTTAWFAMLFSAGMGIGLMFWSVAEPISHFQTPPLGEPGSIDAAQTAMNVTFMHWGFHAWGVYALVGLALAYFSYNRNLPLTIRSVFYPFLGERIHGPIGHVIDTLAVLATLFGLATSLGLGVKQMAAGLHHVFPAIANTLPTQIILIAIITAVATLSVFSGLDKGVRILSEWNMRTAMLLLLAVVLLGPTVFILGAFVQNTGSYLANFMQWSFWNESYSGNDWQADWTIFYWGWWIAWSPFVGTFIARVSKGRTIREFVLGVLIVPSLLTFLWMTAFGSTAMRQVLQGDPTIANAVAADLSTALFIFVEQFPFSIILSILSIILIAGFFITSADSGALVVDNLTSGGNENTPVGQRIFWAVTGGTVAAVLLVGGGLQALQTASIVTGLPFALILLVMCYSLYRGLSEELEEENKLGKAQQRKAYQQLVAETLAKRAQKQEVQASAVKKESSTDKNTEL